jgi:hypothetical protein
MNFYDNSRCSPALGGTAVGAKPTAVPRRPIRGTVRSPVGLAGFEPATTAQCADALPLSYSPTVDTVHDPPREMGRYRRFAFRKVPGERPTYGEYFCTIPVKIRLGNRRRVTYDMCILKLLTAYSTKRSRYSTTL